MAHTIYENFILENKLEQTINTKVDVQSLMTVDRSLTTEAGMTKKVHVYKATGDVQEVAQGVGNTSDIEVAFTEKEYTVGTTQGRFSYYDEQQMTDPLLVDTAMMGMSDAMVNDLTSKYFAELAKTKTAHKFAKGTKFSYDVVVDAIEKLNVEDESGLFLIIANDFKATIRKDPDFKSKQMGEIIASGQIGTISGIPVIVSKANPAKTAYLATKEAVTLFLKKGAETEQERDSNTRKNTVYGRKVALVALTNEAKAVKITEATA